jgi:hypothetical protein
VDAVLDRLTKSTPDQLRRVRQAGATIKAKEELASEARLAKMWAEEERRLEEVAQERAESDWPLRWLSAWVPSWSLSPSS